MKVADLFVELGLEGEAKASAGMTNFTMAMISAFSAGQMLVSMLSIASQKFGQYASNAMQAAVALNAFEAETGLSGQQLNRWAIMAQQANISTGALTGSVKNLQRNINEIRLGAGNIKPFQLMGINPMGESPFEIIEQMRNWYQSMSNKGMAANILQQAGISPEMLQMFKMTNGELEKLSKLPIMTEAQRAKLLELKLAFEKFNITTQYTMNNFIATIAPALIKFFDMISSSISHFAGIIDMIVVGINKFKYAIEILLLTFKGASIVTGIAALVTNPLFEITAGIVALLIVLDDLAVYFKGTGKSLTGLALEGLAKAMDFIIDKAKELYLWIEKIISTLAVNKIVASAFGSLGNIANPALNAINAGATKTISVVQNIYTSDPKQAAEKSVDGIKQAITKDDIDITAAQTK